MKYLVTILMLAGLLAGGRAQAQAPAQTADTNVAPYTADFQYGSNSGYYTNNWTDEALAGLVQGVGGHSLRPSLPESFVERYGYDIRKSTFAAYTSTYGMKELTCFVGGPSVAHTDNTVYGSATTHSKLFANLYLSIWNADGTVNANNYYAIYVYKLLQTYGSSVRTWEVVNEPDYGSSSARPDTWLTRAPLPEEQVNTLAPFYYYVRMLRITYEVVHRYRPDSYVATGGLGYAQYLDALLRYTDNPVDGSATAAYPRTGGAYFDVLSYHDYPSYKLHAWNGSGFTYTRTSDYAAAQVSKDKAAFAAVLAKYHYDGSTHPAKPFILTEVNISRRTAGDRTGSDEMQRNFALKVLTQAQKSDIRQLYVFAVGEATDAPAAGSSVAGYDEFNLMGLYQNLKRDAPGAARPTDEGTAWATASRKLYGYHYDAARTAALALPSGVDGAAFVGTDGKYRYMLWAKALTDNSEQASASYSFPNGLETSGLTRYEWSYAATHDSTRASSQGLALTAAPIILVPLPACSATGSIQYERWDNAKGLSVSDIPTATTPSSTGQLPQLEWVAPTNTFNYGIRLRGYLCVPQTGNYTFWLTSDDNGELWLSPDDNPANKVRQASCTVWTSGPRDYTRSAAQRSAPVALVAGRRYYIEVLHKQSYGSGYASVAWTLPDNTQEAPIAGSRLSPYTPPTSSARLAAAPAQTASPATAELTVYPNPLADAATVRFTLPESGPTTLALYDLQGRLVRQLLAADVPAAAPQEVPLARQQLSGGLYLLRLSTATGVINTKVVMR